jgi:hypothetical protein
MANPFRSLCDLAGEALGRPRKPQGNRLVLHRLKHDDKATQGELRLDGERLCYTLENRPPHVPGVKEPGLSRIPAGLHRLITRSVGRFNTTYRKQYAWHGPMIEILLPGWTAVLFHKGNYHYDTDGCVLLGDALGQHDEHGLTVWSSGDAYARVYPALLELAEAGEALEIRDEVVA